jgi:hypothetical protein
MFLRLAFEELNTSLTQSKRHLHVFFFEYKILRPREKIVNHANIAKKPIGISFILVGHVDITYIAKLLGHASLKSTQRYLKVEIGDLKKMHSLYHPRERINKSSSCSNHSPIPGVD